MRVAVICRGSLDEGLGHVTRAAAVHIALGERSVRFVVIGDAAAATVAQEHVKDPVIVSQDSDVLLALQDDVDAVVLDVKLLERSCFEALQAKARIVSLSPTFEYQTEVARSYSRTEYEPSAALASDPVRHKRGIEYTILGPHVRKVSSPEYVAAAYDTPLGVGIAMGGSDAINLTMRAVEELGEVQERLVIWAMLGEGYGHSYDDLVRKIRESGRHEALLAKASHSMWTVLSRTALLVLAGGVTSYEAAYAGIPAINLILANSRYLVDELELAGAAVTLVGHAGWSELSRSVSDLAADRDRLFAMHRRAIPLIDGKGADRVVEDLDRLLLEVQ
jgi:spore coat polysaccharide biosynthesis predicted glycosyltransferase SpsG